MKLKVAFFNPQGNFDAYDSHLTEHPDFGGQLVYVKELAKAMDSLGVQADIITRQIIDPNWPEFSEFIDGYPDSNVRIIRIPFGGEKFLRKEELWKHLREYVEGIIKFYEKDGFPNFVTTHYGDGGISGAIFKQKTKIPYSFTAHSLGAWKLEKLLKNGRSREELDRIFKFTTRLTAENLAIKYASFIVVSTNQERYEQYSHPAYEVDIYDDRFVVIPPGINEKIFNKDGRIDEDMVLYLKELESKLPISRQKLPYIIMSSRLDRKKNHIAVVKAFMENKQLQEEANLLIVTRGISDVCKYIEEHNNDEAEILKEIKNTLGSDGKSKVLFANISGQSKLASLYRYLAQRGSVFVLPALYEPFGLAVIEAMACGLKVVATKNGGPSEFLADGSGVLIDPEDISDIQNKLLFAIKAFEPVNSDVVVSNFTWKKTAEKYLEKIEEAISKKDETVPELGKFFETLDWSEEK